MKVYESLRSLQSLSIIPTFLISSKLTSSRQLKSDLEKAASGASGACGHFVENHAILRTFWVEYPVLLKEDVERGFDNWELIFDKEDFGKEDK